MEQMAMEYLANALWQLPLLAAGAWLLLRLCKPKPAVQHRVWLCVLALGLLLPLRGILPLAASAAAPASTPATAVSFTEPSAAPEIAPTAPAAHSTIESAPAAYIARLHRIHLNATVVACILALWLAVALWGLLRLALAWTAARRLARDARPVVLGGPETAEVLECARRLGVHMPDIRESSAIAGPVVVGAVHPVLLWPRGFTRRSGDEVKAALCHEIAHIRRRDYAMNLLCEAAALPLRWHPAIHGVERRIRATREMACDDMAARTMQSETLYATCLLSLAQSMVGAPTQRSLAPGLFNGNVMEERIMRLTQNNTPDTWRARLVRGLAGGAAMMAAIALAAAFHVVPAMAQTQAPMPSPAVKLAPLPAVVPQNLAVKPIVNLSSIKPIVNISAIHPAVNPVVAVHVAPHVAVHVAPVVNPVIHIDPVAPVIQIAPAPPAKAAPPAKPARHTGDIHKPVVSCNRDLHALTPAERARVKKQLEDAQRQIAKATAKFNSPEFRRQIEEAQRKAFQADAMLNSAQFKQQMADAQKQIAAATAKINSPEFRKQLEDQMRAAKEMNSAEIQKQMADAQKQIAAATAQLNSPEFKKQLEDQMRAAKAISSAEIQKQLAEAQKQIADELAKMKAEQKAGARK